METFGNEPLFPQNYSDWPGIMPLLEHPSRVYATWVNGNENFYYAGDIAAFNDALRSFADAELDVYEVVLRPGPGLIDSWDGDHHFEFLWHVNVMGGIARHMTGEDKGDLVWRPDPTVSLYVTDESQLDALEIPDGITLLDVGDVSKRVRSALSSTDQTVRGWGAGVLARLNPYDETNLKAIIQLLDDEEDWVRSNAVSAIRIFGQKGRAGIPALERCAESGDPALAERAEETIQLIEAAEDASEDEARHQRLLDAISEFRESRPRS
jgi:hypothetical protein